ncbi:MAG: hypothetical protein WC340_16955 [Kiritimatiellia bacterium]
MARYGQLFAEAMQRPNIADSLAEAQLLAQNISDSQKQARIAPVVQALQQFANNYKAATTDEGRQTANAMANQIRENFAAGGGSFTDLPTQHWGSDPTRGVQTAEGFQVPISGYEGLGRKDTIALKRQALLDALTQRVQEAGLTGIDPDTGQKTWERQYQEYTLANRGTGGGGGGSGSATATTRSNYASAVQGVADALSGLKGAHGTQQYADNFSTESGVLAPIQIVEEQINMQRPQLIAQGIDADKLIDDAYKMAYGVDRKTYWAQANKAIGAGDDFNLEDLLK